MGSKKKKSEVTSTSTEAPAVNVAMCMTPGHEDRPAKTRGLCSSCYAAASGLVKSGKTTWEELETKGKCLPGRVRSGALAAHFLA